jgi:hypothetical protein
MISVSVSSHDICTNTAYLRVPKQEQMNNNVRYYSMLRRSS